jgi:biofilm protein TabA
MHNKTNNFKRLHMQTIPAKHGVLTVLIVCITYFTSTAQTSKPPSEKNIDKWIAKKEWAKGLTLNLHASVNKDSFYVAYHRNPVLWDAAFAFLRTKGLDTLSPGKYPIMGDAVFATISEADTHKPEEVKWESHRDYIDLQYIISGKELIGVADTAKAKIIKPYTPDVINYEVEGTYYTAGQGEFFLFFPNNAHRPTIKAPGYDRTKKIVIKIRTAQQ